MNDNTLPLEPTVVHEQTETLDLVNATSMLFKKRSWWRRLVPKPRTIVYDGGDKSITVECHESDYADACVEFDYSMLSPGWRVNFKKLPVCEVTNTTWFRRVWTYLTTLLMFNSNKASVDATLARLECPVTASPNAEAARVGSVAMIDQLKPQVGTQSSIDPNRHQEMVTGTVVMKQRKTRTHYHRPTHDERKAILKLLELGFSIQQLQDYFGCSQGSIVRTARGEFYTSGELLPVDNPLMYEHIGKLVAMPSRSKCTATKKAITDAVQYLEQNNLFDREYFHEAFDVSYVAIAAARRTYV